MELRKVKKINANPKPELMEAAKVIFENGEQAWADSVYAQNNKQRIAGAIVGGPYGKEQLRKLGVYC